MKRIIALFLSLLMMAACWTACAETAALQLSPTACPPETFILYFEILSTQSGYNFTWVDSVEAEGPYSVYLGECEDGTMLINIYVADGSVVYTDCAGSVTIKDSDAESAQRFGEWFGCALGSSVLSLYLGESGNTSLSADILEKYTADIGSFASELQACTERQMLNGLVITRTVLDYPASLEINGTRKGNIVTINMRVMVTGRNAKPE
jgi:hypothetical protein